VANQQTKRSADPNPDIDPDMSRNTPPPLPTEGYDSSYYNNNNNSNNRTSNYNPTELAEAIRDTVHISGKSSNTSLRSNSKYQQQQPSRSYSPSNLQSSHSYTRSSPDMSHITQQQAQQPMLPSAMIQAVNPFEEDEIEPERRKTKGSAPPRQKVGRATSS
jgi:hypothetical protein